MFHTPMTNARNDLSQKWYHRTETSWKSPEQKPVWPPPPVKSPMWQSKMRIFAVKNQRKWAKITERTMELVLPFYATGCGRTRMLKRSESDCLLKTLSRIFHRLQSWMHACKYRNQMLLEYGATAIHSLLHLRVNLHDIRMSAAVWPLRYTILPVD